jgi:hypothetical protein
MALRSHTSPAGAAFYFRLEGGDGGKMNRKKEKNKKGKNPLMDTYLARGRGPL